MVPNIVTKSILIYFCFRYEIYAMYHFFNYIIIIICT